MYVCCFRLIYLCNYLLFVFVQALIHENVGYSLRMQINC